jgi:hypothetical protein
MKVRGATRSPKRCNHGTAAKTIAATALSAMICQVQTPVTNCSTTKLTDTSTASHAAIASTRYWRAALSA